jgi:hypothetical protein
MIVLRFVECQVHLPQKLEIDHQAQKIGFLNASPVVLERPEHHLTSASFHPFPGQSFDFQFL